MVPSWAAAGRHKTPWCSSVTKKGVLIEQATVRVGNFPSSIEVLERAPWVPEAEPEGYGRYRLYTPVRGDPSLTYIDVVFEGPEPDAAVKCLSCGRACAGLDEKVPDCREDHVISGPPEEAPFATTDLPKEPYGLYLDRALRLIYMTHLNYGAVSLFDLSNDDVPVLRQVTAELSLFGPQRPSRWIRGHRPSPW